MTRKTTQNIAADTQHNTQNNEQGNQQHQEADITAKRPELERLAQQVLDLATQNGATDAEVGVSLSTGLSVGARCGEVETLEYQRDRGVGISVYVGQQQGHSNTTDFSEDGIAAAVRAACDIAKATQPDEFAGLAPAEQMATEFPELDLYHPWAITPDDAIAMAVEMDNVARGYDERISNSDGASVDTGESLRVVANSRGFFATRLSGRHSLSCSVIAGSGDDMQRDYAYTTNRVPDLLATPQQIGEEAAAEAVARLGAQRIKTATVPVLFRADIARGVIGHGLGAISGGALYRNASFLQNALDTQVFTDSVTLLERPHLLQGSASSSYDNDGLPTPAERYLVKDGVLQTYLLGVYSARKLGMQSTSHAGGPRNMLMPATASDNLTGMLARLGTGLLVTEVMGQGVNTVTGDYSRGAAGFWVENGEIAYPVREATIAGNLKDMYQNIVAVGNDIDTRGNLHMGSMLIDNMTIAGEE